MAADHPHTLSDLSTLAREHDEAGERAFLAGDDALAARHWQAVEDLECTIASLTDLQLADDAAWLDACEPAMHVAGGVG